MGSLNKVGSFSSFIFTFKVRQSEESSVCVSWLCRGTVYLPLGTGWRFPVHGLCDSSTPNVGGTHTAPVSCFGFFNRSGFFRGTSLKPCPGRCQLQEGRRDLACSIYLSEDSLGIKESNCGLSEVSS